MTSRPSQKSRVSRAGLALFLALPITCAVAPRSARAEEKVECLDAHAEAQMLRRRGRLREFRARLRVCAGETCPLLVLRDCARWLSELDHDQPTVIIAAHDETGRDVDAVRIFCDGELLAPRLDGRALEIDPGSHVLRGEFPDGVAVEARIIVRDGEKGRAQRLDRSPSAGAPTPLATPGANASSAAPPVAVLALGGLATLALGSFVYFGLHGKSVQSRLVADCRRNCSQEDVDGLRRTYLAADISLGIAVAAAGAATWIALASRKSPRRLAVIPVAGGMVVAVPF